MIKYLQWEFMKIFSSEVSYFIANLERDKIVSISIQGEKEQLKILMKSIRFC